MAEPLAMSQVAEGLVSGALRRRRKGVLGCLDVLSGPVRAQLRGSRVRHAGEALLAQGLDVATLRAVRRSIPRRETRSLQWLFDPHVLVFDGVALHGRASELLVPYLGEALDAVYGRCVMGPACASMPDADGGVAPAQAFDALQEVRRAAVCARLGVVAGGDAGSGAR